MQQQLAVLEVRGQENKGVRNKKRESTMQQQMAMLEVRECR